MYYLPLRYSLSVRCGFLCIDAFAMAMADPLSCPCAISSPHGQKSQTGKKLALLHFDDYLLHLQHISIFKADQIPPFHGLVENPRDDVRRGDVVRGRSGNPSLSRRKVAVG